MLNSYSGPLIKNRTCCKGRQNKKFNASSPPLWSKFGTSFSLKTDVVPGAAVGDIDPDQNHNGSKKLNLYLLDPDWGHLAAT